ncbi:hypothetical protein LTR84_005432 [Exophiala bonariae]|uniref:Uncharacterized protein n=1 Tax=Exophiala bonariae TaxID=1690606 RepID=A0AAV9N3R0_9EURO|nr:hypothetical protein LTR84_005432 [Exophiala bonariae]
MTESSVLEYARHHGLARNHLSEDVIQTMLHSYTHISQSKSAKEITLLIDPEFSSLVSFLEEPRLQLSRNAGIFLSSSIRAPEFSPRWDDFLPDPHRKRKLKLELPLLATDHDEDVATVKRAVKQVSD